jgi:hypothetical protein
MVPSQRLPEPFDADPVDRFLGAQAGNAYRPALLAATACHPA